MTTNKQKMTLLVLLLRASLKHIASTREWIDTTYLDNHSPALCQQCCDEGLLTLRTRLERDEVYVLSESGRIAAKEYLAESRLQTERGIRD